MAKEMLEVAMHLKKSMCIADTIVCDEEQEFCSNMRLDGSTNSVSDKEFFGDTA